MPRIFYHRMAILILSLLLVGALFFGCLQILNAGKIAYGVRVADLKIGGLKETQAKFILENKISQFSQQKNLLVYGKKSWQLVPPDLGVIFDVEPALQVALLWGHRPNILAGLSEQIHSLFLGQNLPFSFRFDNEKFNQFLANLAEIEKPAQNAALILNQKINDWEILPAQKGAIINRDQLIAQLSENLSHFSSQPIYLSLIEEQPQITEEDLELVKTEAQEIMEKAPYLIQVPTDETSNQVLNWRIEKEQLTDWILPLPSSHDPHQAELTLDQNKIKDFLSQVASMINREPINAKLTLADNQVKIFTPSQDGQKLNPEQSAKKIANGILAGTKNIELAVDLIAPEITNENLGILGLTSLLGRGESNFAGSPKNRQLNIALGAAKLNGLLIKPDEEFSFAQNIGEIDEKNGWLPELVIKDKKTFPEYGGGICQVSTTLFRAAVNSGSKITERHPHAYPVRYYNPPGFDATVYPPQPDLKFLNDTPNYILLQSKIKGTKLIFEIYGTADGRQVKVKGPTITQSNPDGSLKTILTQEIWRAGALERQDIFWSSYKSPDLYPIATPTPND